MSDVRLSVTQLDPQQLGRPGTILLDVIEDDAAVAERAIAWATVRGYDRLVPALRSILGGPAPESGFAAVINKPHSLLVFATWPWCPTPHAVDGAPSTEWPDRY